MREGGGQEVARLIADRKCHPNHALNAVLIVPVHAVSAILKRNIPFVNELWGELPVVPKPVQCRSGRVRWQFGQIWR